MGKTEYITADYYCKKIFGCKVYKLALSASVTCPNRDGKISFNGCTFCSSGGSGDFAAPVELPVAKQIEFAKMRLGKKGRNMKYIAYFQSFTGTYGNIEKLKSIYLDACKEPDIVGISIATRPDCLGDDVMEMLKEIASIKPLWIELGLQTLNEKTAEKINRGYTLDVYEEAIKKLREINTHIITHIILGLPGENSEDIKKTAEYVGKHTDGIKIQLLHILKGTKMAEQYGNGKIKVMEPTEYYNAVAQVIKCLPPETVIHRMTGDGAKKDLIAPLWSGDKKRVLVDLNRTLESNELFPKRILPQ